MDESEDLTVWIERLRDGDEQAAEIIWRTCFDRLTQLAKSKLDPARQRGGDEEDVALSAMNSFMGRCRDGEFPQLVDRDDLWKLLMTITVRKAYQHLRRQTALKRTGEIGEAQLRGGDQDSSAGLGMDAMADPLAITPDQLVEQHDQQSAVDKVINGLADDLRAVAIGKLEGQTNDQLARQLGCSTRTIERKLKLIRKIWQKAAEA